MRQRLIYLLKHNAWLQMVYRTCMGLAFRVLSAFIPLDKHLILFSSFMGKGVNDSPKSFSIILHHMMSIGVTGVCGQ